MEKCCEFPTVHRNICAILRERLALWCQKLRELFSFVALIQGSSQRVFILVCNSHIRSKGNNTPYCATSICRTSSVECRRSLLGPGLYCEVVLVSLLGSWGYEKLILPHRNHVVKVLSGKDVNPWSFHPSSAVKMNGHLQT